MPLPSFLKPKDKKPVPRRAAATAGGGDDAGPVQEARTRARRRLIGAVVLLAVGIVGFPLIFETQPRPVALDIPIEAPPRKGEAAPKPPTPRASAPVVVTETPVEVIEEPAPKPAAPVAVAPVQKAPAPMVASAPAPKPPAPVAKADDSTRAKALLEDKAPKAAGRFVVQVGAFTDANALRDARQKVEKLGLKTYTQVVETDAGKRTRVRVGPFATREEADGAGAKLKAAGLPAAVLTL
jgi:DedD protein